MSLMFNCSCGSLQQCALITLQSTDRPHFRCNLNSQFEDLSNTSELIFKALKCTFSHRWPQKRIDSAVSYGKNTQKNQQEQGMSFIHNTCIQHIYTNIDNFANINEYIQVQTQYIWFLLSFYCLRCCLISISTPIQGHSLLVETGLPLSNYQRYQSRPRIRFWLGGGVKKRADSFHGCGWPGIQYHCWSSQQYAEAVRHLLQPNVRDWWATFFFSLHTSG